MMSVSNAPAISIVMPTLNQAGFITKALNSVLAGGVAGGLGGVELVVADGGSSDGTQALLAAWSDAHPGLLRWQSQPDDGGPAAAVNAAVASARGAVIGWLNSDDLYTPDAIARALAHLRQHPQQVMVYGEGEHIDAQGRVLGPYPTRGPDLPLPAWADGCPICQPTAFFRRETFLALGGLDTGLRTAFDYEFWLRLFKAYPGRLGRLGEVQARSRLHDAGITLRLREDVALEALQVIHQHIGPAPAHWLLTHFEEVMAKLPTCGQAHQAPAFGGAAPLNPVVGVEPPTRHLQRLVNQARPWLAESAFASLHAHIQAHKALQLAGPQHFAAVHADGWAGPDLEIRLCGTGQPRQGLLLQGRHAHPTGAVLHLQCWMPDLAPQALTVARPGPFSWQLELPAAARDERLTCTLRCSQPFVPAEIEPGSDDRRALAFLLEGIGLNARS